MVTLGIETSCDEAAIALYDSNSAQIIATKIEFVDIAGLVKGASKGEGLGNQFLSHIREVDAIINVIRCFDDENITHVEGNIDPIRDLELIQIELILADLESLEKRLPNIEKKARNDQDLACQIPLIKNLISHLSNQKPASSFIIESVEDQKILRNLQLITSKPQLFVCNLNENEINGNKYSQLISNYASHNNFHSLNICAQIESEIANLEDENEKIEFLESVGLEQTGLAQIIKKSYKILNLITFFTAGPQECRAWTVKKGSTAPNAAGVIHTDFEKGFIKAQTISYNDYIDNNGEEGAKNSGKLRLEGKEYIVSDGDIFHFRFNN